MKENVATVFEHAEKLKAITAEELACEMRWRQGAGLLEIIDNVIGHLERARHLGALGRVVELNALRKRMGR